MTLDISAQTDSVLKVGKDPQFARLFVQKAALEQFGRDLSGLLLEIPFFSFVPFGMTVALI